jgi:hypothetical protein
MKPVDINSISFVVSERRLSLEVNGIHIDEAESRPNEFGGGRDITTYDFIEYLGITAWPYVADDGSNVTPGEIENDTENYDRRVFIHVFGIEPTEGQADHLKRSVVAAASKSEAVRTWSSVIDFPALHAFDGTLQGFDILACYRYITANDVTHKALRRFAITYPVLSQAICNKDNWTGFLGSAKTDEEAYKLLLHHVTNKGIPAHETEFESEIGPLSLELLKSMEGRQIDAISGDFYDTSARVTQTLNFARRLPATSFPENADAFDILGAFAEVVWRLTSKTECMMDTIEDERGFDLNLSDADIAAIFAVEIEAKFDIEKSFAGDFGDGNMFSDRGRRVWLETFAFYGIHLAGHDEWLASFLAEDEDELPETFDYSALKVALISDGFQNVLTKANEYYNTLMNEAPEAAP